VKLHSLLHKSASGFAQPRLSDGQQKVEQQYAERIAALKD
jgi:hypothetical protein